MTLDEHLRPTAVAAGDCEAAHAVLVGFVRDSVGCRVDGGADVIVTGPGAPLDVNLYQAVKALDAVRPLVDGRTRVLLLAACAQGVGAAAMVEPFRAAGPPAGVLEALRRPTTWWSKTGPYMLAEFLTRPARVHAWCPGLEDQVLEALGCDRDEFRPPALWPPSRAWGRAPTSSSSHGPSGCCSTGRPDIRRDPGRSSIGRPAGSASPSRPDALSSLGPGRPRRTRRSCSWPRA